MKQEQIHYNRKEDELGFESIFTLSEEVSVKEVRFNSYGDIYLITADGKYTFIRTAVPVEE